MLHPHGMTPLLPVLTLAAAFTWPAIALADNVVHPATLPAIHPNVAQVQAGQIKTAHASWWGFDSQDATEALQNAIDSGVPTLIIDKMPGDWIVSRAVNLVSNQTLILADGVVIRAKEGAFKNRTEPMFRGHMLNNLTIQGQGHAVVQMRKADYHDASRYEPGEWRHGFNIVGCTNVTFRNFTIKDTGGDGLYLGRGPDQSYCQNILVEDMIFDGSSRLGMAVISVQDLVIRRCRFINALGSAPQGGIDFEPNHADERLVNCLIEDCVFENNVKGGAIIIAPNHMRADSIPISITVRNSVMRDNARGVFLSMSTRGRPGTGTIDFINCRFERDTLLFQDPMADGPAITFKDCLIDLTGLPAETLQQEALRITAMVAADRPLGHIHLDNLRVIDTHNQDPISIKYFTNTAVADTITGMLHLTRQGRTSHFDLQAFRRQEQAKAEALRTLQPTTLTLDALAPGDAAGPRPQGHPAYLRGKFTFIQHARPGQAVTLRARSLQVSNYGSTPLELLDPDGQSLRKIQLKPTEEQAVTFTAQKEGYYRLISPGGLNRVDVTSDHPGSGLLVEGTQRFLPMQGNVVSRLYFQVPAGVRTFSLSVAADAGADVILRNPQGQPVMTRKGMDSLERFTASRPADAPSEIWSLEFTRVAWQLFVGMHAPLAPVLSTHPHTLPMAK